MPGRLIVAGHRACLGEPASPGYFPSTGTRRRPFLISLRHLDPIDIARRRPRGTLSPDDPRLDTGRRPAVHEPPSVPPEPALAGSPPDCDNAVTRREAL